MSLPQAPSQSQPTKTQPTGHPQPRRASPENSITLRHHRLARDASLRADPGSASQRGTTSTSSPRRNSSGESHETGQSDPKKWFDQSNQNPTAMFDNRMDVDPPFFQKESDSSAEERPYYEQQPPPPKLTAQSSSADDYRSVIDDLTIEIQRLKEELRRYKQPGPDMLRKDKLFEIKIHGLPGRKKRELEAALRDFTASFDGSPDTSSSQPKSKQRHANRKHVYSGSGSASKHASSSSGSNVRPADSAYASMSTGAKSYGTSLGRPSSNTQHPNSSNEKKVQDYLRDIPEGLYPQPIIMTDKEKKKLVVKRLEQLFTGKFAGAKSVHKPPPALGGDLAPVVAQPSSQGASTMVHQPPKLKAPAEPAREARILPTDQQQQGHSTKTKRSADNGSMSLSNSNGDQTESGGNGNNSTGSGTNPSPPTQTPPEQRPTRPRDLDPDRAQIPWENMNYIRHLGLVPPELLAEQSKMPPDVHPDADGWVYLNLLCSMAQLHIINVTPDFVRSAVSEMSHKFQLSPDGRKIRWRGGSEGTKFSSDSSGYNSQKSPSTDDTDNSKSGSRKRQKTGRSSGDGNRSGGSSRNMSKFGPQVSTSSESFHYKPMFAQQESPHGQTSMDDTLSSFGPPEDSSIGESRWGLSGSGASNRRKRRHDGAIIYYSGAPFCTDLSGDPGDTSPATQMLSNSRTQPDTESPKNESPLRRTASGSFINYRPLSDRDVNMESSSMDIDHDERTPGLTYDSDSASDIELDLEWSDEQQYIEMRPLEPCGLGGVLPDDHFVVVVTTRRSKHDAEPSRPSFPDEATESIVRRLETMSTSSPVTQPAMIPTKRQNPALDMEYLSGRIKRLAPVPLPPPAIFFPPFSTDNSTEDDYYDELGTSSSSEQVISRRANPHQSDDYPDGVDLSSGDEDGEDPDDSPGDHNMYDGSGDSGVQVLPRRTRQGSHRSSSAAAAAGTGSRGRSKSISAEVMPRTDGSSVATAGGVKSGNESSSELSD